MLSPRPVEAVAARLADCYEANELGEAGGRLRFAMSIAPNGDVESARIALSVGLTAPTERCIERVLRSTMFDPPGGFRAKPEGEIVFVGPHDVAPTPRLPTEPKSLDLVLDGKVEMPPVIVVVSRAPQEVLWMRDAELAVESCVDPPAVAPAHQTVHLHVRVEPSGDAREVDVQVEGEGGSVLAECLGSALRKGAFRARASAAPEALSATFSITKGAVALVE